MRNVAVCAKMTQTKAVPLKESYTGPPQTYPGKYFLLCAYMSERVFTLMLQTNETQRWISFHLDLSKSAVPFVLSSQIHKELTYEEVSIGPMIAWSIWRKIGMVLLLSLYVEVCEQCAYVHL